jgi:hypothetical protein
MRQPIGLKAHFRDLVTACGGTKRAAEIAGMQASHLSEAMAAHNLERWPRIDHVALLESECGAPIVTKALADAAGFDIVRRDAQAPHLKPLDHLRSIMKESAEVHQGLADALADARIDPRERRALLLEVDQALAGLNNLRLDLLKAEGLA